MRGGGAAAVAAGATEVDFTGLNPNDDGNGDILLSWTPGVGCAVEAVIRLTG